jgi:cyclase
MGSYGKGLHEVGDGCWAWLQPDGSWGWSNAGLITGDGSSLLVDTLFDLHLTREMLDAMDGVTRSAPIGTLVNTHANGDHCYGNELVTGAEIVATKACAEEMGRVPPSMLASMVENADEVGPLGEYVKHCFGPFDFHGITLTVPTRTFEGRLDLDVAGTAVELIDVGPAHTEGDLLAYVPDQKTVFTGDICFIEGTPIMWAGPMRNWIAACDLICSLDVETVVPGHGPITDKTGVQRMKEYLEYVDRETRLRHAAGLSAADAARDIALGEFAGWLDAERLAVNVDTVYRELDGRDTRTDVVSLFTLMSEMAV